MRLSHDAAMTKVSPAGGSTPPASTTEGGSANGSPLDLYPVREVEMALRLGAAFRTSPDFWMNAQKAVDLYEAAGQVQSLPRPLLKAS